MDVEECLQVHGFDIFLFGQIGLLKAVTWTSIKAWSVFISVNKFFISVNNAVCPVDDEDDEDAAAVFWSRISVNSETMECLASMSISSS